MLCADALCYIFVRLGFNRIPNRSPKRLVWFWRHTLMSVSVVNESMHGIMTQVTLIGRTTRCGGRRRGYG